MRRALSVALLTSLCLSAPAADADKTYNTTKGVLSNLALSADGRLLAVAGDVREKQTIDGRPTDVIKGGELTVWDTRDGKKLCTAPLQSNVTHSMRFSPDGTLLALTQSRNVILLDPAAGKEQRVLKTAYSPMATLGGFSPDGKTLVSVANDLFANKSAIQVWDVATGEARRTESFTDAQLTSATLSADAKRLFAVRRTFMGRRPKTAELVVWDLDGMKEVRAIEEKMTRSGALTPDGKTIVAHVNTSPGSYEFRGYDVATGKQTWKTRPSYATKLVFPAAGNAFYIAPSVTRYQVGKDDHLSESIKTGLTGNTKDLAVSADGSTLAVGGGVANDEREVRVIRLPRAK